MNRLKHIREQRDMTQSELAKRLGISVTHLNKVENHKRPLTIRLAVCISEELDCKVKDLFF
ncbi:hypothetical protein SAMN05192534_1233 [Alteribacillus persepolensis]|uniref:HTH cro/C1-type domain-containing protein n=1 Tax=Alteribacillus persepolensis TaxID=568899 RepID=A0A1G8I5Q4_9BACI|nr:helix-turn-helix transcriptional regulator [Alteribacillus persepolensis]SDI14243.1 hypothetical protein SAMN05192534_1233 [Alteribacillus persepolensis]